MVNTKKIIIGVLVIAVVITAYFYFFKPKITPAPVTTKSDPFSSLMEKNSDFAEAEKAAKAGDLQKAEALYQSALEKAQHIDERGQIEYKIADVNTNRDPIKAIGILKGIAANSQYSNIQRAYAIQQMGEVFFKNSTTSVTTAIFTGDPYSSFNKEGDSRLAYRRLYEYAASFYPLSMSEVRASVWYSSEILRLKKTKTLAEQLTIKDELLGYRKKVLGNLELADRDIERTRTAPNAGLLIPYTLALRAAVLGYMYESGDRSFPDPEIAFKEAIGAGLLIKGDGPARLQYAVFLARNYGAKRKDDIAKLLAPVGTGPEYAGLRRVFTNEKNNVIGSKSNFILISQIDPDFRKLLISLGWDPTKDFK